MRFGLSIRRLTAAAAVAALFLGDAGAVTEPPPEPVRYGLYEWMAVAPIVIAADILTDDGKFVRATVRTPIKGALSTGDVLEIDQHQANRDRDDGVRALDLVKGKPYLLLLKLSTRGKRQAHAVYELVRGVSGAKALPIEGATATIDAVARLAEVQTRRNDEYLWTALPEFLEDGNPVLVDAALDLYVKFRREGVGMAANLLPLLAHPRPEFRRRAALLLGRLLLRAGAAAIPERSQWIAELAGRARRDEDATVRREATAALAALPDPGLEETLGAIARDDPDQDVRFEAEKALLERKEAKAAKRSD